MKRFWAILAVALCLSLPDKAFALSCARPSLDDAAVEAAVMIFEGIAGPKRGLGLLERAAVRWHGVEGRGGGIADLRVYRFKVTQGWKGSVTGQSVDIVFNSYWGDGFAEGEAYLVVSPQQVGKLFWAPLCGHTVDLSHADKIGNLALLEQLIGIGHHLKIRTEDRICERAKDCASVQTHCGGCSCGTPLAKAALEGYEAGFEKLCAAIRFTERCELDCPLPVLSCKAGVCVGE